MSERDVVALMQDLIADAFFYVDDYVRDIRLALPESDQETKHYLNGAFLGYTLLKNRFMRLTNSYDQQLSREGKEWIMKKTTSAKAKSTAKKGKIAKPAKTSASKKKTSKK